MFLYILFADLNFPEDILALKNQTYQIELFWKSTNQADIKFYNIFFHKTSKITYILDDL
jgi:hypothetical protein